MNVIISNKNTQALMMLNIDVIKSTEGVFTPGEIVREFKTFFYNKLIIDITAIKNYEDINSIRELSLNFDMNNTILLLDDSEVANSPNYLSQLVSMGVYNFTQKIDSIPFLIENQNSYKDVASYQTLEPIKNVVFNEKKETLQEKGGISKRIIGVINVTEHAGATTLTYLLKKHLEKKYKTIAAEVNKQDFPYFADSTLVSISSSEVENFILNNKESEVILLDLNDHDPSSCTDKLYLIEAGLIKLNKLIKKDYKAFEALKGEKIILNKSVLTKKDVRDFEKESDSKVFFNIPNVDDKSNNNPDIIDFLITLGFSRISTK